MEKQEFIIMCYLKELGIPPSLSGYHYLKYAIEMMIKDMSLINAITKTIYPTIAHQFDTTSSRVERAIRHAIEISWIRGNCEIQDELFGHTMDANKSKPTNGEFIATISNHIRVVDAQKKR